MPIEDAFSWGLQDAYGDSGNGLPDRVINRLRIVRIVGAMSQSYSRSARHTEVWAATTVVIDPQKVHSNMDPCPL